MECLRTESGFVDNWQSGKSLKECNLHMWTSGDSCDVTFRVGKDERIIQAHRYILISRSCVFHAMLCGPLAEDGDIKIPDVEEHIFADFLRFLYTDESTLNSGNLTGLFYLAKKYAVGGLEFLCLQFLETSLSPDNACVILEEANLFDEKKLYDRAFQVIMENGDQCLGSQDFLELSPECFDDVVCSDDLSIKPEGVFNAAVSWSQEHCRRLGREITPVNLRQTLGETLYKIPFPNMSQTFYVKEVLPKQILTSDENVAVMANLLCPDKNPSPFRRRREQKTNLTDVVFYNKSKMATGRSGVAGRIDFTCDNDILLCGVYVYGSVKDTETVFHIKVQKYYDSAYLENNKYTKPEETEIQGGKVIAVHFVKPVEIKKDASYFVYVEVQGSRSPQFEGDQLQRKVTVAQYTFHKLAVEHQYCNLVNLVHGFILR